MRISYLFINPPPRFRALESAFPGAFATAMHSPMARPWIDRHRLSVMLGPSHMQFRHLSDHTRDRRNPSARAHSVRIKMITTMQVTLPPDLARQIEQELATGRYQNSDQLIAEAVRYLLEGRQRGQRRLDALRRIGAAVDQAG